MHSALAKLNLETDTGMPIAPQILQLCSDYFVSRQLLSYGFSFACSKPSPAVVALDVLTSFLLAADILNEMIKSIRKVCLYPLLCLLSLVLPTKSIGLMSWTSEWQRLQPSKLHACM